MHGRTQVQNKAEMRFDKLDTIEREYCGVQVSEKYSIS